LAVCGVLVDGCVGPLVWLDPVVAGDHGIVFVELAIAVLPAVELARTKRQPTQQERDGQAGDRRVMAQEVDHRVALIVGNPLPIQLSPMFFLCALDLP